MVNREIVMDYILSCLQDLVENGVEIKPDSDLVNDLGLESIKVMDLLMMLEDRFDISIPINIPRTAPPADRRRGAHPGSTTPARRRRERG